MSSVRLRSVFNAVGVLSARPGPWAAVSTYWRMPGVSRQQEYSRYPPAYIKPTYLPSHLQELEESKEMSELEYTPVRAAYNTHTSSLFHDPIVRKFTNHIMKGGNKALARELVEQTFQQIKEIQIERRNNAETEEERESIVCDPLTIFHQAVENGRPLLQLLPVKRGGVKYQVPSPVTSNRSYFVSMRWLKEAGREKERTTHFPQKMARELLAAARNEGRVVKKKQDLHRQCEANRAYAHYRWS